MNESQKKNEQDKDVVLRINALLPSSHLAKRPIALTCSVSECGTQSFLPRVSLILHRLSV